MNNDAAMGDGSGLATGSTKRPRDLQDEQQAPGKWSLDNIGDLLFSMRGDITGLTRDVQDMKHTVSVSMERQ